MIVMCSQGWELLTETNKLLNVPDSEEGPIKKEMEFSFTSGTRQGCLQLTVTSG